MRSGARAWAVGGCCVRACVYGTVPTRSAHPPCERPTCTLPARAPVPTRPHSHAPAAPQERVRAWRAEVQAQQDSRQQQLQHTERALELRERAVCSREAAAEAKAAEAAEAVAGAQLGARAQVG